MKRLKYLSINVLLAVASFFLYGTMKSHNAEIAPFQDIAVIFELLIFVAIAVLNILTNWSRFIDTGIVKGYCKKAQIFTFAIMFCLPVVNILFIAFLFTCPSNISIKEIQS